MLKFRQMKRIGIVLFACLLTACASKTEEEKEPEAAVVQKSEEEVKEQAEEKEQVTYDMELPDQYWTDFMKVCELCEIDVQKVHGFDEAENWGNGERYSFQYQDETYQVDFLTDGYVRSLSYQSATDGLWEEYYRRGYTTGYQMGYEAEGMGDYKDVIILVSCDPEPYGEMETLNGQQVIRYHLPAGDYRVTAKTGESGLYVETVAIHEEEGYEVADVLQELVFSAAGEEAEIAVREGECLFLMADTIVELEAL